MVHDHKLFPCLLQLRHTWLRGIGQLMSIRIPSLEEASECTGITFVNNTVRFLYRVDAIPLPDGISRARMF